MFSFTNLSFDSLFAVTVSTAAIVSAKDLQTDEQRAKSNHYVPRRLKGLIQEDEWEVMNRVDLMASLGIENISGDDANDLGDHTNEEILALRNSIKKSRRAKKDAFEASDQVVRQLSLDAGVLSSDSNGKKRNHTKRYLKKGKGARKGGKGAKSTKSPNTESIECSKTSVDVVVQYDDHPEDVFWGIEDMNGELVAFGTGFFTPSDLDGKKEITSVGGLCAGYPYEFFARDMYSDGTNSLSVVQGESELDRISRLGQSARFQFTPSLEFTTASPSSVPTTACDNIPFEVIIKTGENPPRALWWGAYERDGFEFKTAIHDLQANAETTTTVDGFCAGEYIYIQVCNGFGDPLGEGFSVSVNHDGTQLLNESLERLSVCVSPSFTLP